jgi:hypothetical protein
MTRKTHGDPFEPSVEQVARNLLEFARQEPSLIGRAHTLARGAPARAPAFDLTSFGSFAQVDLAQQVEQLAAIAITASQQAEDASQQARETVRTARRNMVMFGALGVLGILSGAAAIADNHLSVPGTPATITEAALTPPAASPADPEPAPQPATYVPPLPLPPASTQPARDHFVPPAYHPPSTFVAPWPRQPVSVRREAIAVRRPVAVPSFFVALQRGINSLFAVPRNF